MLEVLLMIARRICCRKLLRRMEISIQSRFRPHLLAPSTNSCGLSFFWVSRCPYWRIFICRISITKVVKIWSYLIAPILQRYYLGTFVTLVALAKTPAAWRGELLSSRARPWKLFQDLLGPDCTVPSISTPLATACFLLKARGYFSGDSLE